MPKREPKEKPLPWLLEDLKSSQTGANVSKYRGARYQAMKKARPEINFANDKTLEASALKVMDDPSAGLDAPLQDDDNFRDPVVKISSKDIVRRRYGMYKTSAMRAAICAYARCGAGESVILHIMGITRRQLEGWWKTDPDFHRDYLSCKGAWTHGAVLNMLEMAAAKGDWKALQWVIERNAPEQYGPNPLPALTADVVEGSVATDMDPANLVKRLAELAAKAQAGLDAANAVMEHEEPSNE